MAGEDEKKAVPVQAVADEKPSDKKDKKDKKKDEKEELTEEDQRLIDDVDLLVTRSCDADSGIAATALQTLGSMLRTATGTVASIPKPLKYVRPHFPRLRAHADGLPATAPQRKACFDVLAMIAMTLELPEQPHASLELKLQGNLDDLAQWGHEFLRHLAGDIAAVWQARLEAAGDDDEDGDRASAATAELVPYVHQIIAFMMHHQDEPAACDLAMEVGLLDDIAKYCDESNHSAVCLYLTTTAKYLTVPEDQAAYDIVFQLYMKFEAFPNALLVALATQSDEKVSAVFGACTDERVRKQLAFMCGRARFFHTTDDDEVDELIGNGKLSEMFRHSGKELDSLAPRIPEDIYKEHLLEKTAVPDTASSHMHNLATTWVNGFANAGFGTDKLLTETSSVWLFQHKEHRMMSAAAAMGMLHLWDQDEGLAATDKLSYSEENYIKAGALLATGIVMCGVRSAFSPALGLLSDHVSGTNREMRVGAILGLGFAYAGMRTDDVKELLVPLVVDPDQPVEIQCMAAYALALVYCGTRDEDISEVTMSCLMEKTPAQLAEPCVRFLVLGLSFLFLGAKDAIDPMLEASKMLPEEIQQYAEVTVLAAAYAGTCDVVTVQKLFTIVAAREEEDEEEKKADAKTDDDKSPQPAEKPKKWNHKAAALCGIGIVAMGEDLGGAMTKRAVLHSLLSKEAGDSSCRRGVPLALALLSVSDPQMPAVENLAKLSHDSDPATVQAAIFGLGLVSAGTNNARASTLLRNLTGYYAKDKEHHHVVVVRLAQALCNMGKGHITLAPRMLDNQVVSPVALTGVMTLCHCALDLPNTFLGKHHYMAYSAALAATPRMLLTVDGDLTPVQTHVRVGNPVDTVALPGKPKTITGFQTHSTPVLTNSNERAELVPGKHVAVSVLEGVVVVTERPEADEDAAAPTSS